MAEQRVCSTCKRQAPDGWLVRCEVDGSLLERQTPACGRYWDIDDTSNHDFRKETP